MLDKQPKYCVITGAAGGIGLALARVFYDAGYRVIATDIVAQPQELNYTHYLQADLEQLAISPEYTNGIVSSIRAQLEGNALNVLVNNAAIQILGGVDSLRRADWQTTLDVNLLAPFLLIQALLPELEKANGLGCVINIGSIHARLTKKNFVAYAVSKAAIAGLTRAMAVDLGSRVRINAIEPAAIKTEMLKMGFKGESDLYRQLELCHPQERLGEPFEIASLAHALAEGALKFVHGSCVAIDGGISGMLHDPG